jgi:hypothetical protein
VSANIFFPLRRNGGAFMDLYHPFRVHFLFKTISIKVSSLRDCLLVRKAENLSYSSFSAAWRLCVKLLHKYRNQKPEGLILS